MNRTDYSFASRVNLRGAAGIGRQLFNKGLALLIVVLISPLLLLIALGVRICLGSPVLFKQKRSGFQGRPFEIYKFRSMVHRKPGTATSYDLSADLLRITNFGHFLRKFSLDELPQLFNVVRGDMNLVGPRPFVARYLNFYSVAERQRLGVLPGITGWAQVHGRDNLSWPEKIKLDLWYIRHRSFLLDLRILFKTVKLLLNFRKNSNLVQMPSIAFDEGKTIALHKFPSWPVYAPDEIAAVERVLKSGKVNYWTGNECRHFEREFADYVGSRYAVTLANGSVALELALRALGVGAGDDVIVPARTFFATAGSVALCGATPIFADVDNKSQNVTADTLRAALTERTKAIVVVHLAGWPCDMKPIMALAKAQGLKVIEDCAQAHGARYDGLSVGVQGDIGTFSFCQDKIISTGGEGGMLVTSDKTLWERVWSYKDHGKSYERVHADRQSQNSFRWLHTNIGTNLRMTEMQAAIGRVQLTKLDNWLKQRRALAAIYAKRLSNVDGLTIYLPTAKKTRHAFYKFYVFIDIDKLKPGWNRDRLLAVLSAQNIPCGSGSCPEVYREKAFSAVMPDAPLPVASRLGEVTLMLPIYPTLREIDVNFICERVLAVVQEATSGRAST